MNEKTLQEFLRESLYAIHHEYHVIWFLFILLTKKQLEGDDNFQPTMIRVSQCETMMAIATFSKIAVIYLPDFLTKWVTFL